VGYLGVGKFECHKNRCKKNGKGYPKRVFAEPKGTATTGSANEKNTLRGWRVNGPVDRDFDV
jgi:hypothetical protein